MNNQENYERYGPKWKKAIKAMSKDAMLEMIERICKERDKLREEVQQLNRLLNEQSFEQEPDYDNPAEREADQREASAPTPYDP
jgi:hypothetical protein